MFVMFRKRVCLFILVRKEQAEKVKGEFGKKFWGNRGRYIKTNMLRTFVMKMTHGYKQSLKGVTTSTLSNEAPMTLTAANTAVFSNTRTKNQNRNDDDEAEENVEGITDEGKRRL